MKRSVFIGAIICCFAVMGLVFSHHGFAAQEKSFKWPQSFVIGVHGTSSLGFSVMNGVAPIMSKDTGMNVRVVPEDSEVNRAARLINKEFDIAVRGIGDSNPGFMGTEGFAAMDPQPTHIVWLFSDTPFGFFVVKDSKYKTIYDLKKKGVRVARSVQSPSLDRTAREALPAFIGWTPEEAAKNWIFVPSGGLAENARLVADGRADVALSPTVSGFMIEVAANPRGIRFLSMDLSDKAAWKRFLKARPAAIPVKMDHGVGECVGVDGFSAAMPFQARVDADEELVYQTAKWFHTNIDKYKGVHKLAIRMDLKYFRQFLNYSGWPVHKGTVRYLKEIGQWTAADDKWNNEAVKLLDRYTAARKAALAEAKAKGVKMHWQDPELIKIISKHTADLPVFAARVK